ncbi:MAG: hypothetical protein J6S07_07520 [Bacteroidaceae bacterium]|nr:hypothetical protein [Bacteroidaceae bacterium]
MKRELQKRNTPISRLIRDYTNKESGRVSESKLEIKRRFEHLDWKDQKRIVSAFLASCRSDREWMYVRLLDFWDDCFAPRIAELWEQYHEERCAWVVIRHLPEDYIISQIDCFSNDRDYYFVCRRLAHRSDFCIDRERLSLVDYLSVLVHAGQSFSKTMALDLLYELVNEECNNDFFYTNYWKPKDNSDVFHAMHIPNISKAIYYLKRVNFYDIVEEFERWNDWVVAKIQESPEYQEVKSEALSYDDYLYRLRSIGIYYLYQELDSKYKTTSLYKNTESITTVEHRMDILKSMRKQNTSLDKLVEKLSLELLN